VPVRVGGHRNLDAWLHNAARHLRREGPAPSERCNEGRGADSQ
jgi:hypothetical protein